MDFGKMAKQLRKQAGLTQEQVANLIGVSKSVISFYELRERTPSPYVLVKYATIFHISTDYLLGLQKNKQIDVSDLTEHEINAVLAIIEAFRTNKKLHK